MSVPRRKILVDSVSLDQLLAALELIVGCRTEQDLETKLRARLVRNTRPGDIVRRLDDLGLTSSSEGGYSLTRFGAMTTHELAAHPGSSADLMHACHYLRHLDKSSREYFYTYKLVADEFYLQPTQSFEDAAVRVLQGVMERFQIEPGSFGFDKTSVGKALHFIKRLSDGDMVHRDAVRASVVEYAVRAFLSYSGFTPGQLLLLSDSACAKLARALFVEEARVRNLIAQANGKGSLYMRPTAFGTGVTVDDDTRERP